MTNKFYCKICHKELTNRSRYDMYMHIERFHLDKVVQIGMKEFLSEVPEIFHDNKIIPI
jgi:hypothetical protein